MPRDKPNNKSSLRRSLRPRRSDKASYQVGDVVEVSYKNGIEIGTLICQVTSDKWIVKYKNNNMHEQQVSEKCFGQIIHKIDAQNETKNARDENKECVDSFSTAKRVKKGQIKSKSSLKVNSTRGSGSSLGTGTNSSDGDSINTSRTRGSSTGIGINRKGKKEPVLSAREKRMRMRQEVSGSGLNQINDGSKTKKRRKKTRDGAEDKNVTSKDATTNKKKLKKEKEEVIKVKLNTGTLYLYRGMNPRAVFMRRDRKSVV